MSAATQHDFVELNRELDIVKSKVFLKPNAAFFGPLMCGLDFRWDTSIPTAATDGVHLMWNPNDFRRCRDDKLGEDQSTLMHELWHDARIHNVRRGSRCPDVWNIACDIWINRELKKAGYYVGKDWVLRPDLDKIELEEDIYDHLQKPGGGGAKGGSIPGSGHGQGHCSHQHGAENYDDKANIANIVKGIQAAKMAGQPGAIPGNMEAIVDRFLTPIIPWEQHLYQFMSDLADEDYTWGRPARRYMGID